MTVAQLEPKLGLDRALEIALPKQKQEIKIAMKVAEQAKKAKTKWQKHQKIARNALCVLSSWTIVNADDAKNAKN